MSCLLAGLRPAGPLFEAKARAESSAFLIHLKAEGAAGQDTP